jgi:hypothetical protein
MRTIIALYIVSLIYSSIRYVVFAPKNLENFPVFVINKGWSMAAALCFMAGFIQALRKMRGKTIGIDPGLWFRAGVFGAIVHIPISLAILRPGYFREFFVKTEVGGVEGVGAVMVVAENARLSFGGEMVFLFGGLTAGLLYLLMRPANTPMLRWALSLLAMSTLMTHVLAMGYCRGLNINADHAYLPPMWLLSAIGVAVALAVVMMSRPRG